MQLLKQQISDLSTDPEKLKQLPHKSTIYHRLMDPTAFRDGTVPSSGSLYEEGQALMFGGADTVGNTLMVGTHHLLQRPKVLQSLKKEMLTAWPTLSEEPKLRDLEALPYLNAVIKESLRMSSGVVSGLLRVVPLSGATINGITVPGEVCRFMASTLHEILTVSDYRFLRQHVRALQRVHFPRAECLQPRTLAAVSRAGQLARSLLPWPTYVSGY